MELQFSRLSIFNGNLLYMIDVLFVTVRYIVSRGFSLWNSLYRISFDCPACNHICENKQRLSEKRAEVQQLEPH